MIKSTFKVTNLMPNEKDNMTLMKHYKPKLAPVSTRCHSKSVAGLPMIISSMNSN